MAEQLGEPDYTKANFSLLPFSTLVSNVAEYTLSTPAGVPGGRHTGSVQNYGGKTVH